LFLSISEYKQKHKEKEKKKKIKSLFYFLFYLTNKKYGSILFSRPPDLEVEF
jgi:hypothetical protein